VKENLVTFGVPVSRMQVVFNAIEHGVIAARAREALDNLPYGGVPIVITVGRHAEQKDHETLIRAFARTRQRVPARLVLIGQGPLRGELEGLARELGVAESVVFAGWQANPFAWLARSDLFVLSSRYEGFGNVIVEAMACGLPVISTDCPSGPNEILRNGEDGLLVPVADVEALADAMTNVLTDEALRSKLAQKASRRAPDFDISVIGPQYETLLQTYANVGSEE
jgi:glycosyltransferase involved in cell wall biosynthesis